MKKYILKYQGFFTAIIIELIFLLLVAISSIGKVVNIDFEADNLMIYDSKAEVIEYEAVDSLMLDENTLVVYDNKESQNIEKSIYITCRDDDTEPYARWLVGSEEFTLRPGVYELEVKYYSLLNSNKSGGSSDDYTGCIQIVSDSNDSNIYYNDLFLYDNVTVNTQRLWIQSLRSIDDVQIKVVFNGMGELRIDSIVLKELPLWRLLKLFAWIILFSVIDLLYIMLFTDNKIKNKEIIALLAVVSVSSSIPLFANYLMRGHDVNFHVSRIWALAENIKVGNISYPIQTEMVNGYGYASPIFYGQIFLYIPAFLYILGVPIQLCYQIYAVSVNVATVFVSYFCIDGIVKDKRVAVLGSALYTLSAYRLIDVYLRAAVGEYTSMLFLPLIMYGFIKIYAKDASKIKWKECLAIIIGLTGLIQTHILSCEIVALLIIVFCIIKFKKTFEPKRFIALSITAVTTVLFNIAFLVPFISSMKMHISVYDQEIEKIQIDGTYLLQLLCVFMTGGGSGGEGMQGETPKALGFSLVLGIGILLWCCINKYKWNIVGDTTLKVGTICTGFAVCCIILSLRNFPWDSLEQISPLIAKILCVIQFPWRYLEFATVFAVVATIAGIIIIKKRMSKQTFVLVEMMLVVFTVLQMGQFYTYFADGANEYKIYGGADVEQNTVAGGEYLITDTDDNELKWRSIKADLTKVGIAGYESDHGTIAFVCNNISDEEQFVQIPILNYDNYHAYAEDGTELRIQNGENNRLGIWVPSGYNGVIKVQYEIPLLWKIANVITAITFLVIVFSCVWLNRRKRRSVKI